MTENDVEECACSMYMHKADRSCVLREIFMYMYSVTECATRVPCSRSCHVKLRTLLTDLHSSYRTLIHIYNLHGRRTTTGS